MNKKRQFSKKFAALRQNWQKMEWNLEAHTKKHHGPAGQLLSGAIHF
jgi:hypothetical protein